MIFRQFLNEDLACASYLVADRGAGVGVVVDPAWQIEPYLALAGSYGIEIAYAVDTHVHADHVSGRERLAAAAGATSLLAGDGLEAGDKLRAGHLLLEVIATPGHRPEHVSLLVTDLLRSSEPCLLLAGDSLLTGGVARPDLAADNPTEIERAARDLFRTLRRLSRLPAHVQLWPGHIGGSLCVANDVSDRICSTIGFELHANRPFANRDQVRFVADVTERLPERPPSVEIVVARNRRRDIPTKEPIARLEPAEVTELKWRGAVLIDGRRATAFDAGSVPGSLSIPLEAQAVGTKAAWCAHPLAPVVAIGGSESEGLEVAARLAAVGFEDIRGVLARGFTGWTAADMPVCRTARFEPHDVDQLLEAAEITLVDVRDDDEHAACHVPGSLNIPWRQLGRRWEEAFRPAKPVVVACATGGRTPLAASLLARHDLEPVARLVNGGVPDLAATVNGCKRSTEDTSSQRHLALVRP